MKFLRLSICSDIMLTIAGVHFDFVLPWAYFIHTPGDRNLNKTSSNDPT
jgi:hypothetical protein